MQLPVTVIAAELSLSYHSVYNAVKKHKLTPSNTVITDEQLDVIVSHILQIWPTTGKLFTDNQSCRVHFITAWSLQDIKPC